MKNNDLQLQPCLQRQLLARGRRDYHLSGMNGQPTSLRTQYRRHLLAIVLLALAFCAGTWYWYARQERALERRLQEPVAQPR